MKQLFIACAAIIALSSCKKDDDEPHHHAIAGETVSLYGGKASTETKMNHDAPEELVLTIDAAAMNSLPIGAALPHQMFVLKLPAQTTQLTNVDHIGLDWNPSGHEPTGIYTIPHFDVHYYMMPHTAVMAITDMAKMNIFPPAAYLPTGFVPGPPIPQMGMHWLEAASPELNGGAFTQTFIYGSYDGKVTFYEPMVTKAWLMSISNFERSIPQPSKVLKSGWYPQTLQYKQENGNVKVILKNFTQRTGS